MTLHIFNPEHDIALASGLTNFTAPHAGRQLRHDMGWIPALWADDNDAILVDDGDAAQKALNKLFHAMAAVNPACQRAPRVTFTQTCHQTEAQHIDPWGWDAALCSQLAHQGVNKALLPDNERLTDIRQLSHRQTSAALLSHLTTLLAHADIVGESCVCGTSEEVEERLHEWGHIVVKAPWSSSGRGVRFVEGNLTESLTGWLRNVMTRQGQVMVEPYYHKVKDFGMEFTSDGEGHITYEGLSLFHTQNGAYTGNLLATEAYKRDIIGRYLPAELLDEVQTVICTYCGKELKGRYAGPFGVDMMIVADTCPSTTCPTQRLPLHPCVAINLRRPMGHAALSLTRRLNPQDDCEIIRVVRIVYKDNQYRLTIQKVEKIAKFRLFIISHTSFCEKSRNFVRFYEDNRQEQ